MRIFSSFLISLFILSSCTLSPDPNDSRQSEDSGTKQTATLPTKTPEQTVKDFLIWYDVNYKDINKMEMVKNSPPTDDTLLWYSVDFKGTEYWLKKMKESGFVSDNFIIHWKNYFNECEKAFQKDHVWDGPPAGFDYDLIFNSQEDFPSHDAIQNATAMNFSMMGNKMKVVLTIPNYGDITKIVEHSADGKWLLAE